MRAVCNALDRVLYVLMGIALTVIVVSVAAEVFLRFVLGSSIPWSGELATMGLVWMSLLGGSYAIGQKSNIRIGLLATFLPARARTVLECATNVGLLCLFAALFVVGLRYTVGIAPSRTGALVVSQAYFFAAVPVAATCMGLYTLAALLEAHPWRVPGATPAGDAA